MSNHNLEATESWRKAGFLCKPFYGNDREDARRFYKSFERALDLEMLNKGAWTCADVLLGNDEGGTNNPSTGNAAARANKDALHLARAKHVLALLVRQWASF